MDQWEEEGIAPLKDIFNKMGELGFLGIRYDPKYGGQGLDYWYDTVFLEELGHIRALGLSVAITVQTHMATPAIAQFGNEHREVSMGKLIANKVLIKVADGCLQMHGGLGLMNEMLISRSYRDAKLISIGGGADEVMSDVIAKLEGY